ncbi:hypothetical protein [Sphingobium lignivorans]|uniref:DUF4126 domain-containing protein n=1 Tax=Sphingobium lignivorans TaxID=2735886 RepID=A0ABR6NCB4_9SPHN|nr:hypothetical protein [Sphingobium lignivorans]MBB5984917.1 hypothetical protein [Sphingobium lignivorans]
MAASTASHTATSAGKAPAGKALSTPAKGAVAPKARAVARSVGQACLTTGEAGIALAEPVMRSLRSEQPSTLAKMALAAATPRLVDGAIRFAIRNPVVTLIGVVVIARMKMRQQAVAGEGA